MHKIVWLIYSLSFLLLWFENKIIVLPTVKRPVIFGSPSLQFFLWIIRLAFQYGSIIGIWYFYGIVIAIVAFAISYIFGKITFKVYFNREVHWTAMHLVNILRKELETKGEQLSDDKICHKARIEAYDTVVQNMKTGGRGF